MAKPARPPMTMEEFAADITDIGDTIPSPNVMVYGPPKCGKTALTSQLSDSFMLAFDPGWQTARHVGSKAQIRKVYDFETLQAGLFWLEDGNYSNFRWILADGLNMLQTRLTQQFAKDAYLANPEKRVSEHIPDRPDFYRQQSVLKNAVARLCDLPVPVVFTCHSQESDDNEGDTWIRPHIEGREYQVGNFVTGLMSSIGYLSVVTEKRGERKGERLRRIVWTQCQNAAGTKTILAGDQLGVFPDWTDDLSATQLDELVLGPTKVQPPRKAAAGRTRRTGR